MRTAEELFNHARELHVSAMAGHRLDPEGFHRKLHEAEAIFDMLIAMNPMDHSAHYGLATVASDLGRNGTAMAVLTRAIQIKPTEPLFWLQLGTCARREQKFSIARECYDKAVELSPGDAMILAHRAGCNVNQGDPEPGIGFARRALKGACEPESIERAHALALSHMAMCLLELERWGEGWDAYDHRSELPEYHKRDFGSVPRWNGTETGRLHIHAEQGLGDEILFASILDEAIGRADHVTFECQGRLLKLFQRSFPTVTCYPTHEAFTASGDAIDAWDSLGSLGRFFRRQESDFPRVPFLIPDPIRVNYWRQRLMATGPAPYVGVAWKGGTKHTQEVYRRTPRSSWQSLVKGPATFISLQYGPDAGQEAASLGIPHWQPALDDLDEFAALVAACDLVVTVCQTAVHFAGGLGVPAVVITPSKPAWRYHLKRDDMLFYNSVRIARQVGTDWSPAFQIAESRIADLGRLQTAE